MNRLLSPNRTIAVLLGASDWTNLGLGYASSFRRSVGHLHKYLISEEPAGLGLKPDHILNLFDDPSAASAQLSRMSRQVSNLIRDVQGSDDSIRDVLIYYVGHGSSQAGKPFYFLIANTEEGLEEQTSISAYHLADTLKSAAPQQRRIAILDCCYSEAAAGAFSAMGQLDEAVASTVVEQLTSGIAGAERGTLLLCSCPRNSVSIGKPNADTTLFSGALLTVLKRGSKTIDSQMLSFADLRDEIYQEMLVRYGRTAPRPALHQPDQRFGDLTRVPAFPNAGGVQARQHSGQVGDESVGNLITGRKHRNAEAERIADQQRKQEAALAAERKAKAEAERIADHQRKQEAALAAERKAKAEAERIADQQRQQEAALAAERKTKAEAERIADQQRKQEAAPTTGWVFVSADRIADERRKQEATSAAERKAKAEVERIADQQRKQEAASATGWVYASDDRIADERRKQEAALAAVQEVDADWMADRERRRVASAAKREAQRIADQKNEHAKRESRKEAIREHFKNAAIIIFGSAIATVIGYGYQFLLALIYTRGISTAGQSVQIISFVAGIFAVGVWSRVMGKNIFYNVDDWEVAHAILWGAWFAAGSYLCGIWRPGSEWHWGWLIWMLVGMLYGTSNP